MVPVASETDVKWLEHRVRDVATTAAGISGELSAYKKDLHVLSDRVLIIETQRDTEKDQLNELSDDVEAIDDTVETELTVLKKDYEELRSDFDALNVHFSLRRILTYTSLAIGSLVAFLRLLNTLGITITIGG